MNNETNLSSVEVGQSARVVNINGSADMRRRLQDLGLICGTTVECVMKSPAGDPTAYSIRGASIALRAADSGKISVILQ